MKNSLLTMILSLTLIAAILGAALGWVHEITAEPIAQAQAKAKNEALTSVLPADCEGMEIGLPDSIRVEGDPRDVILYPVRDNAGALLGAAVETWTMDGFAGEISVMAGFDSKGAISGYRILQSAETPGLGSKAAEWFEGETPTEEAASLTQRSILGTTSPLAVSKDGGQIDGITAATITSRAFLQAINRARAAYELFTKGETHVDTHTQASPKK